MSDNSDLIKEYLEKAQSRMHDKLFPGQEHDHHHHHDLGVIDGMASEIFDPTFPAHLFYYNQRALKLMRRVFRDIAGTEPWTDSITAVNTLVDKLLPGLVALPFQAMADGYQLTCDEPTFAVQKYTRMGKLDEIYNSDVFNRDSELIAMEYLADEECVEMVKSLIMATVIGLGTLTGYKDYSGHDLFHIWDVFLLTTRSTCTSMYLAGREMGKHAAEEDALAGILAATEQQEST